MNGLQAAGWICIIASFVCSLIVAADSARRGAVRISGVGLVLGAVGVALSIANVASKLF